ncbi:uncharacterized protein MONOS_14338 [Monocercomonoides exilis]|uniref:uncharacterized protein n=1 Tax=Monocercomonoides exilis TaxID=2049356 RepID=UPI00355994DA|nr:hypothetical protein MONOS_14338 [Monocercomonoides exilis]
MSRNIGESEEEREASIKKTKDFSKTLWGRYNSGFIDDTSDWKSTTKDTYTAEQFTILHDPDAEDPTHHKKKSEEKSYMEASIRQRNMMNLKPTGNAKQ